ncbi:hypothetical protein DFP73DRAFT_591692 [Morchella snyderi]|nr:hypothetical protein DFP73DRAFT_591692 [Morchella snyderi]
MSSSQTPHAKRPALGKQKFTPQSNLKTPRPPQNPANVSPSPMPRSFTSPSNSQDSVKTLGRSQVTARNASGSQSSPITTRTPPITTRTPVGSVTTPSRSSKSAAQRTQSQVSQSRPAPVAPLTPDVSYFNEEEEDDYPVITSADDEEESSGGERVPAERGVTCRLQLPHDMSSEEVQAVLDAHFYDTGDVSGAGAGDKTGRTHKKRRYDSSKLTTYFTDGRQVWSRCNRISRLHFARYLQIQDKDIPSIIHEAVGPTHTIDNDSDEYAAAYEKILEWRKNWFHSWMVQAQTIVGDIVGENLGYSRLDGQMLVQAYEKEFSYEVLYQMTSSTVAGLIDWRATLADKALYAMYKTFVTYTFVYIHRSTYSPIDTLPRSKCLELVHLVPLAPAYKDIGISRLVLLAARPISKLRVTKKIKATCVTDLDPNFQPLAVVGEDGGAENHTQLVDVAGEATVADDETVAESQIDETQYN